MNKLLGQIKTELANLVDAHRGVGRIYLPPAGKWTLASTGVVLAAFSDGASDVPGVQLVDSKGLAIRWNNHAAPLAVMSHFYWPDDIDVAVGATLSLLLSKSGATVGDATTMTSAIWNHVPAALHDADTDFGGASSALTGNATAKTLAYVTRAIALGDLPATRPCQASITTKPTAGTLGTDDLFFWGGLITYTKKRVA